MIHTVSLSCLDQIQPVIVTLTKNVAFDFRCSSTGVGSAGGIALAEALKTCKLLKKLDLRDNMFGPKAGVALSNNLSIHANLTEIYFSYLNLEDEGTIAIANTLKTSKSPLEIIEMAGNNITSKSANALADCMVSKKYCLTKINLSENKLNDEGAIAIGKALGGDFGRLSIVDLSANGIKGDGAISLSKAVVGKSGFRLLNINRNFLSDKVIEGVREVFKNFPCMLGPLDENGEDHKKEDGRDGVK